MNKLSYSKRRPIAYGISNGVLGATLLLICIGVSSLGIPALQISAWPGFVAWACYFAAGGTFNAVKKALAANTAGMLMGIFMLIVCALLGGSSIALGIGVLIGAFLICIETVWTPLSFTPGIFAGCACTFGFNATYIEPASIIALAISLWAGAFMAWACDGWGAAMAGSDDDTLETL